MKRSRVAMWPFTLFFAVFVWQFAIGLVTGGKGAEFMFYMVFGMLPLLVFGSPWFPWLMPSGELDISYLAITSPLALRYHGTAFVSLMLNALIFSGLLTGLRRWRERRRS